MKTVRKKRRSINSMINSIDMCAAGRGKLSAAERVRSIRATLREMKKALGLDESARSYRRKAR
jgi:hypothetical protein